MPFVVPPSTRGKTPQKPLLNVIVTRLADKIAGRGLENFRIEWDLRAEAEQTVVFSPSGRDMSRSAMMTTEESNSSSLRQSSSNFSTSSTVPMPNNNNNNNHTTTVVYQENSAGSASDRDTICCMSPPDDTSEEDKIVINKYGAHFVYIPTLGRYIARADRKTVRASTISGRFCFVLQCLILVVGLWALLLRSVDCLGPPILDDVSNNNNNNHNRLAEETTSPSNTITTDATAPATHRRVTAVYPGWHHLTTERSGWYVFIFFVLCIGGTVLQFFMIHSGDRSLGNPGYLSIEGDDQVAFELSGEYQNCVVDCAIPHELRRACKTCGGPQPLRCRHCKSCGRCVPRSDHHCFWLGHCIGSYDYGSFVLLITVMALMASFGLDFLFGSWINVWDSSCGIPGRPDAGYFARQWHANGFTLVYILVGLIAALALWLLVGSHVALTASEMTTYEFARPGKCAYMRYYPAVPALSVPLWNSIVAAFSVKKSSSSSSSSSSSKHFSPGYLSSPFSENGIKNFINLWWHYGTRSMFNKFGVGSKWHIRATPTVRSGSIDGVNYFVMSSGSSTSSAGDSNRRNGSNIQMHELGNKNSGHHDDDQDEGQPISRSHQA